ncbi:MAG: ABC transporter permease [Rhodospirillales bacterium]|nr:ABC transporter permease [Rhodospirillales bacterium]
MIGNRAMPLLNIYATIYLAFLYAPMVVLPLFSFNESSIAAFPIRGWTLRWYQDLLQDRSVLSALQSSVIVAITAAVASTGFGLLAAMGLTREAMPGRRLILTVLMLPLLLPPLVLGLALLTLLHKVMGMQLSYLTVILGHVVICLPYSILVLLARFEGFDRSLEDASLDLGQNALQTFRRVTLPLVFPGVVASLLLASVISFDEFLIAFFLSGTDPTLPMIIWRSLRFPAKLPLTLALGTSILVLTTSLVVLAEVYRRRQAGGSLA